jgi:hypothetical protein
MSKRKRASLGKTTPGADQPHTEEPAEDAAKEDMVHVTPDLLSGPDVFSSKAKESAITAEPSASEPPAAVSEPSEPVEPQGDAYKSPASEEIAPAAAEAHEAPETAHPVAAMTPVAEMTAVPSMPPPHPPAAATPMGRTRRGGAGSSAALGIVLVVVGLFALLVAVSGLDMSLYGWPLFVILPGVTLLVIGFVGVGPGASIPGGIVTVLGLLLAYQNSTGDWPSWAFAWALVAPGGVGLGMYLQALRDRDPVNLKTGRSLMFIGLLIFMIGFVLFESILGISNRDYGIFGKAALPALLIVIGLILLLRSIQRSRRA